jgi:hypothetical protein
MLLSLLCAVALAQVPIQAPERGQQVPQERRGGNFGLGIVMGAPTGLAGNVMISDWSSVQFSLGGDLGRIGDLGMTVDYMASFRPFNTETDEYAVPLQLGGGLVLSSNVFERDGEVLLGPRLVGGVLINVKELPIDIFMQVAPTLYLYEYLTWSTDGQFGMRYYF